MACYKTRNGNGNGTKRNEIKAVLARQLIIEHFDFASSQLNSQCKKSDDQSDNLESKVTGT